MTPDPQAALLALENARQSIRRDDRRSARRWAQKAVSLDPNLGEAWLMLAAVASPRASVIYLERALRLDPGNEQIRRGLEWACQRLEDQQSLEQTRPHRAVHPKPLAVTRPMLSIRRQKVAPKAPDSSFQLLKSLAKFRWSYAALALLLMCVLAGAVFAPGSVSPALAFLRPQGATPLSGAAVDVEKPTYTPTFTATSTYTPTASNTPTYTPTFTPTNTPLPTDTPLPTATPWPTATPFQPATAVPTYPPVSGGGVRWIDVDISQQMVYAYEGDTIVASFLVSTGVAAYPTVIGQFHIYWKLEYTLMAGPGYYLPNVPYTMYFYRGYGLHGTYWHSNFGTPMSHGCVNMYTPDAQWLFYWAPLGTLVNVHY